MDINKYVIRMTDRRFVQTKWYNLSKDKSKYDSMWAHIGSGRQDEILRKRLENYKELRNKFHISTTITILKIIYSKN